MRAEVRSQREAWDRTYERDGVEFGRFLAFSDEVFAIAATLLVVGVAVPVPKESGSVHELAGALNGLIPDFVSFLIGLAVIGRYRAAHHQFFGLVDRLDEG